jgi:anthranilate phosphoribosyltransferase
MSALHDALIALVEGRSLTEAGAEDAIGEIMDGAPDSIVGAFLIALKIKGAEAAELAGGVRAMLARARPLNLRDREVLDTCGTGGDGADTFNISTGAALIAAAAGVPVAKHGNRAISGKVGTADVLEAFGVKVDCDPEGLARCLDAAGCCLIFAPAYHPGFARLAPLRRELKIRTIFNLMGSIGSPARPRYHLLGVAEDDLIMPMAHALKALGTRRAMVVRGTDGIDEISISGPTKVAELREDGEIITYSITPEGLGVGRGDRRALMVDNLDDAVRMLRSALDGGRGPAQDVLALNGGAAIYVGGKCDSLHEGVEAAREIIASSRALEVIEKMRLASQPKIPKEIPGAPRNSNEFDPR